MSDPREPLEPGGDAELDTPDPQAIDDGGDGDDLEPELDDVGLDDEPEPEPEPQDAQPRRRGRAAETITSLRTRAQTAEAERQALERRLAALENRPAPVDPMAAQRELEAENARLAMMSPEEQGRYWYQKGQQETQRALAQHQLLTADSQDRRDYAALKREVPAATRLETQVEATLQNLRNQGIYAIGREAILNALVGAEVLQKSRRQAPQARQNGQRRIQRQTTNPANPRGDVPRGRPRQDQRQADIDLLRSVTTDAVF